MAKIELKNISHSYKLGEFHEVSPVEVEDRNNEFVIKNLDLNWEDGSANALLGPSGCGKTTILSMISGLLRPTMGKILLDGKDVTPLRPEKRGIAQVFQFPVVYDTVSVYDNLAFPLKNAGATSHDIKRRVEEIADILDLTHLLRTSSGKISQADKQKVSLGRGIVRKNTAAILLDEPLTVIDPKEKYVLRRKLREVQKRLKITMIYVTHDQHEALTFADLVTVMKDGQIVQTGTPEELHNEPASPFVGYFIGSPGMNLLECTLKKGTLDFGEFSMKLSDRLSDILRPQGVQFTFGIRPEFVEPGKETHADRVSMHVEIIEKMGSSKILNLRSNGIKLKSRVHETVSISEGEQVWVHFPEDHIKIFKDDQRVF